MREFLNDSDDILNQARTIVYFCLVILALILLTFIGYLIIAPSPQTLVVLSVGMAIYLVTLACLRLHKLTLGSNILIFFMFFNLASVGFMQMGANRLLDFYLGTMMILMQISTVVLKTRDYQYWLITVASPVAIVLQFT